MRAGVAISGHSESKREKIKRKLEQTLQTLPKSITKTSELAIKVKIKITPTHPIKTQISLILHYCGVVSPY